MSDRLRMTPGVPIRTVRDDDAPAIQAIYAPVVRDTTISFEESPPSVDDMEQRIRATRVDYPYLVCAAGDGVAGYAYASAHRARAAYRWSVDVSVYVAVSRRGHGVARALYTALLGVLDLQGFHAAFAGIALPNAPSVGLHEALGFTPVGVYREVGFKHGRWHDVGWWQRALGGGGTPAEPLPFFAHVDRFVAAGLLTS